MQIACHGENNSSGLGTIPRIERISVNFSGYGPTDCERERVVFAIRESTGAQLDRFPADNALICHGLLSVLFLAGEIRSSSQRLADIAEEAGADRPKNGFQV